MISEFKGAYRFLSNFWLSDIVAATLVGHVVFPSVEHIYQSMKTLNTEQFKAIVEADTPGIAKRMGQKVDMRPDWDDLKIGIMIAGTKLKFDQHPDLRAALIATSPHILQEGNWWGDEFWGVNLRTGRGENNLGKILMDHRSCYILEAMPVNHKLVV
jgi:ribA/ribD-fused uncharacterized protein